MNPSAFQPERWNVVFHPRAATWWLDRAPVGRFKHVSAFAYVHGVDGWVVYDVSFGGTDLLVLPCTEAALDLIERHIAGCTVVAMRRSGSAGATGFRLGFWCVPAVKHLLGLTSGALRPDALLAHCLANGGEIIHEGVSAAAVPGAGRSESEGTDRAGGPRQDCGAAAAPAG